MSKFNIEQFHSVTERINPRGSIARVHEALHNVRENGSAELTAGLLRVAREGLTEGVEAANESLQQIDTLEADLRDRGLLTPRGSKGAA